MRRSYLVAGGIIVLLAVVLIWNLRRSGDGGPGGGSDDNGSESSSSGGERGKGAGKGTQAVASIGGKVTRAADGAPVAGATVAVAHDSLMPMMGRRGRSGGDDTPPTVVTTDAKGEWIVKAIQPGTYSVGVTAAALQPGSKRRVAVTPNDHTTVDLALVAGGVSVTGTVADVGGGPIGGARVTTTVTGKEIFGGRAELVAITGTDGKYQLHLSDGEYMAVASHEDYTRAMKNFEVHGSPLAVDFVLAPGGSIRGVVVTRDGKPVPNAHVNAETGRIMRNGGASATADDSGAFTLTSLVSGAIKLSATAKGYASAQPTVVELGIGEQVEGVRIVVDKAFSISGRVVRAGHAEQGIAGIMVGCFSMGSGNAATSEDPTDDTGNFEIYGVKPASYMLFAFGEGSVPDVGKTAEVVDKDVTGIVIELATGVVLSGKVDPAMVSSIGLEFEEGKIGIGNMFDAMKAMTVRGESDATGAFTLKAAPPGEFLLVATTTDGRKGKLAITVGNADQTNLVVKLEQRASIAGKVIDEKGVAVAGVRVNTVEDDGPRGMSFRGGFGDSAGAVTGLDGSFKLVGLEPGKVSLVVEDEHGRIPFKGSDKPQPFELTKAQAVTGVTLTVEARDGVIKGVVVGADKAPVPDAWVTLRPDFKPTDNRRDMMSSFLRPADPILTGADGTFTASRLRRGLYQIAVEGPKGASRASKNGVKTGDTVTLVLEPLGSIVGRVTIAGVAGVPGAGAPMKEFDLGCRPEERGGMRFTSDSGSRRFTNADGSYQVDRLQPGEYTCSASSNAGTATGKIVVATGPATLDLVIVPYATITGTVVDAATGKPVAGLIAFATGDGVDGKQFMDLMTGKGPTTDAAGRFTVERIPAGKGQVHVAPKDATFNHLATRDYTATAGQKIELGTIKLVPPRDGASGTYGFFPMVKDDVLTVGDVKDDTPASRAGLVVGDKIIAIDGKPVSELGADVGKQLLMPGAVPVGARVSLTLERGGQQVPAALVAIEF